MKKRIAGFLALVLTLSVCGGALAGGDTFTLAELKAQAPERLQMTVTSATGETVTVDAPVILPDADVLPVLKCKSQLFETARANDFFFPDKKSRQSATYKQFVSREATDAFPFLNIAKESAPYLLTGKTDTTRRSPLAMGETPPESDFTLEQAVELILRYNAAFGGNPDVDLRPTQAVAMSGLCKMKSAKVTNEATGVSVRAIVADPERPVKGKEKGLWLISLSQYLHGVRVIDDSNRRYRASGYYNPYPTKNRSNVMDGENFRVFLSYLQEEGTLTDDYPLAGWDAVESSIRALIEQGKLKSVYQVELVYLVKMLRADHEAFKRGEFTQEDAFSCDFALVPVWEIKGWNLYKANEKYFASGTSPDRETILMNNFGQDFQQEDYVLRLNADTAKPFEPENKIYDGEINAR
ncbi:MAG: hypothetical protein MRZ54_10280 [Clostridiales bacterium]|nr:hypothetical protein [Clostridiales bacterium]